MRSSSFDAGSSFGSWRANLPEKAFFKAGRSTSILLRSDAHCPCVRSRIVSPCAVRFGAGLNCHEEFDLAIESMQEAVTLAGKRTETLGGLAQPTRPLVSRQKPWNWSAELEGQAGRRCLSPYLTSKICACLGDNQRAFARLDQAYEARNPDLIELQVEPVFDALRADGRYESLLNRLAGRASSGPHPLRPNFK